MSAANSAPRTTPSLPAGTTVGPVSLTVSDLGRSRAFYEEVLGLAPVEAHAASEAVALGAGGGPPLVVLYGDRDARPRDPRASGLFHLALLLPDRAELGRALLRVARARWPLSGASDHLVSEALYLSDPDGNGIELYRDRRREEWPREEDGTIRMATLALDLADIAAAADGLADSGEAPGVDAAPAGTRMGHVHLQVASIPDADAFYAGVLGFDVTVRTYPGALFVSAGGYHHHVGLNTWNSAGHPAPPPGALGLRQYEIVLPDATELARVRARVEHAGVAVETGGRIEGGVARDAEATGAEPSGAFLVRDPSGVAALLRAG